MIGNHIYIASGVVLSGKVTIEENTLIGDGAVIIFGKKVGKICIIRAGNVVAKDAEDNIVYMAFQLKV